jgi:hypothetical protein
VRALGTWSQMKSLRYAFLLKRFSASVWKSTRCKQNQPNIESKSDLPLWQYQTGPLNSVMDFRGCAAGLKWKGYDDVGRQS